MADQYHAGRRTNNAGAGYVIPPGGEGEGTSLGVQRINEDWKRFEMASGTSEQVVYAGSCRFGGVILNNGVTSGVLTIRDAASTGGGSAGMVFAEGTTTAAKGARMSNGITAAAATTGAGVTILYREADFT